MSRHVEDPEHALARTRHLAARQYVGTMFETLTPPAPTEDPARFAAQAAATDDADKLLAMAERCANAILDAQGSVTVGEVREALGKLGLLENAGREQLCALGALGRRMKLVAIGRERQVGELAKVTHGNIGTRWVRP